MKYIMIKLIDFYKMIPISSHDKCKYYPTCSTYSKIAYERFGFFKGTYLTIKRLLRCNPFSKGGYDPVPERKIK
ncbi:MAG: membrane protein insertion efficiency factor YidD [Bacilli bacterium]